MRIICCISVTTLLLLLLLGSIIAHIREKPDGHSDLRPAAFLMFVSALLLRLILSCFCEGSRTDLNCFGAWAVRICSVGPADFYSADVFTDYPPGYMYLLYPAGALISGLDIPYYSGLWLLLLKLPSVLCDMAAGLLIFHTAKKRMSSGAALLLTCAYLFNPCILLNSSVWGQIDSVLALLTVCICLALVRGKMPAACLLFGVSLLFKPQILILSPVLIAGFLEHVVLNGFCAKKLFQNLLAVSGSLLAALLLAAPFGIGNVISQYAQTLGSYPYASVNAYNFWSFLGLNWADQETRILLLPVRVWGMAAIVLVAAVSAAVPLLRRYHSLKIGREETPAAETERKQNERKHFTEYPLLAALLYFSVFTFSARMHERYLYPALLCLIFAYIYRPSKKLLRVYALSSAVHFCNTAHVLFFYNPETFDAGSGFVRLVSFCMVCCTCCLYGAILSESLFLDPSDTIRRKRIRNVSPILKNKKINNKKIDLLLAAALTLLYSLFALHDLGNREAPSVCLELSYGDSIELRFETSVREDGTTEGLPANISFYTAPVSGSGISFSLWERNASSDWRYSRELEADKVFSWQSVPLSLDPATDTVWLGLSCENASVCELVFTDDQGKILLPANASDYPALFDEQELFPAHSSFRDSMYFDEIYHARTAYEFLHGLVSYENTHPPLGKILILSGIALFGMNPFGWRIAGALFGIGMVPLMYLFAKKLTKDTPAAALACALFSFDFMHFTQSRLATVDVYITFFVILMYFFMYRYGEMCLENRSLNQTLLPLGACGISMGLGFACKWTGAYAGIGLAVIFFGIMLLKYQQSRRDCLKSGECRHGTFSGMFYKTVLFCILFFILIPALIYLLSYIPFRTDDAEAGLFSRMLENQRTMFDYHSSLNAAHPYSSPWYTWPIMERPVWYYSGIVSDTLREGISAFGNPLVWWPGIPAFFVTLFCAVKKKDRTAAFLVIAYLAQYIPWMFVSRVTFIYHYFPSVPFVTLMIVYSLLQIRGALCLSDRKYLCMVSAYAAFAFGLFLLFYPVLAGEPVDAEFVDRFLRWGKDWVLTAR